MSDSRWIPPGPYRQKLLAERFVPWPLHKPDESRDYTLGVLPISEWGPTVTRGFVSDARFARNGTEQVIKRTNRQITKRWRGVAPKGKGNG